MVLSECDILLCCVIIIPNYLHVIYRKSFSILLCLHNNRSRFALKSISSKKIILVVNIAMTHKLEIKHCINIIIIPFRLKKILAFAILKIVISFNKSLLVSERSLSNNRTQ